MGAHFFGGLVLLLAHLTCLCATDSCSSVVEEDCCNGLPNISARFQPDNTSFDIFADLLVFCAQESGSDNWAEVINATGSTTVCDIKDVRFGWNVGFRVGLGYGMCHDEWDTQLYYTRFSTQGNDHISSNPGSIFSPFLGNFYVDNPGGAGISGIAYQRASILWKVRFNMFDWELGRSFWVSHALSLRPFIGLKGGWIHQLIHTKWQNPHLSGAEFFHTGKEDLKNNFWGLGPCGGLKTKWNLVVYQNHSFSLLGDLSGAIMWGHWTFGDQFTNDIQQEVSVKLSNLNSGATMLRTFMGFGWDASFCQFHFSTKLGYEMQFWLDQLQFYSFDTGRLSNELTLQGGTLEFCVDF